MISIGVYGVPKQTFYNLQHDKKETLINSAIQEFSRVSLFEASISNIVKEAGIPRGSFYQYFEDKEDIYFFLLAEYSKRINRRFISVLKSQDGDLFGAFIESFHIMLTNLQNLEYRNFFRNAFLNMNYKVENTLTQSEKEKEVKSVYSEITELIDMDKLNIQDESEVVHVIKIIKAVTFQNLIQFFAKELPFDESIRNYTIQINMLKRGLFKE